MDTEDFNLAVDYMCSNGVVLSPEHKVALQNSLVITKQNYKFAFIKLWGKVLGIKQDYYIAYGTTKNEFNNKTFLYR